jgi:UDP-glucose 4-epimerase
MTRSAAMSDAQARGELVVVTGGAGFIGSHTVGALLARNCRVVVLDDFSSGHRANLAAWRDDARLTIVEVDVAHGLFAALAPITAEQGPVARIVHLAAQISVVKSIDNPMEDLRQNLGSTVHVLEYARAHGVQRVTFASSAAVYGDVAELPVAEEAPKVPLSPYGIHKLASEMQLRYYREVHGVSTAALRFFNVYGPRQDPTSAYSGVISIFMDRSIRGSEIVIFGDGEQTRDFVYVGDVARAIVAATFVADPPTSAVNVGTSHETTVNQLAEMVRDLSGSKSEIRHAPARAGEIRKSFARISAAAEGIDFRAEVAITDGLRETIAWFRSAD